LPHVAEQPPCFVIGVSRLDTIVCPTTSEIVGNTTANPRTHHEREGMEGTPVLGEEKGDLEPFRGLIPVQVAIPGPSVSLHDLYFSQVGVIPDPSIVSQGGRDS